MSKRGDTIRAAGGLLKRNNKLGIGFGQPIGGDEGEIRVQMLNNQPRLYARAGGRWYNTPLYITPVLGIDEDPTSGLAEFGSKIIAKSFLTITGHRGFIDFQSNTSRSRSNISIGNSRFRPLNVLIETANNKDNITMGNYSMSSAVNAQANIAMGDSSMRYMGINSGNAYSDTRYNIAIGDDAMKGASANAYTFGSNNIAIGYNAAGDIHKDNHASNTTDGNICIGTNAGQFINKDGNIYIGYSAGKGNSSGSDGLYNISMGFQAIEAIQDGDYNICLGYDAGDTIVDGDKNIMIGFESDVQEDGSNRVALGNSVTVNDDNTTVIGNTDIILDAASDIILDSAVGKFIMKGGGTVKEFSVADSAYAGMTLGYTTIGIDAADDSYDVTNSFVVVSDAHKVKFVAPPSGAVEIEVFIYSDGASARPLYFGLSDASATTGYSPINFPNSNDVTNEHEVHHNAGAEEVAINHQWVVTDLTAGTAYEWWLGAACSHNSAYVLRWGGNVTVEYAPFIMKATALPTAVTDFAVYG